MIYEVAHTTTSHRHGVKTEEQLADWVYKEGVNCALFQSVYCYNNGDYNKMALTKASEWVNLQRYIQWVPIDIDKGSNTDETTLNNARTVLHLIMKAGTGLCKENIKIYFSGRGYHIMIHERCFGFNDKIPPYDDLNKEYYDLPYVVKETVKAIPNIEPFIDISLYQRNGLIRCTYSLHAKSGLYKTPITLEEFNTLSPEEIKELCKSPRYDFPWEDEYYGDGELAEYLVTSIPPVRVYATIPEPTLTEACIYKMFNDGPVIGTRHNVILRLVSFLRRVGMPSASAKAVMLDWNNNDQEPHIITEMVESGYKRGYVYGCSDSLRMKHCNIRCSHYKTKDIPETADTFEEIYNRAVDIDYQQTFGTGYDLGSALGMKMGESDFIVTRGEIISVLGLTKAGKSTLMKNIALGIDFTGDNLIIPANVMKTLYYTCEQDSRLFMLYLCMILENCNKQQAYKNSRGLLQKWRNHIKHIIPINRAGNLATLKEHIEKHNPLAVCLDTMDHFVDVTKGAQGITDTMLSLQDYSAKYGTIFWCVNQISRADARENSVTLFSGKGSGAIENQSRKVIGISHSDKGNNVKKIEFLANTYGNSGQTVEVQLYSSARMRSIL